MNECYGRYQEFRTEAYVEDQSRMSFVVTSARIFSIVFVPVALVGLSWSGSSLRKHQRARQLREPPLLCAATVQFECTMRKIVMLAWAILGALVLWSVLYEAGVLQERPLGIYGWNSPIIYSVGPYVLVICS